MKQQKVQMLHRVIVLLLCIAMIQPVYVDAVEDELVMPKASYYLDSYQTYIYPAGSGKIQVWFDVTCVNYMDELGALTVWLYESTDNSTWGHVETFHYFDYSTMLDYDDISFTGHVDYQGVKGRYYKAYVCIWAGKDGDGDTRYLWTSSKKAT